MREIAVFLAKDLYKTNSHLVESLRRNEITVYPLDIQKEKYADALEEHQDRIARETGRELSSPRFCVAFETAE